MYTEDKHSFQKNKSVLRNLDTIVGLECRGPEQKFSYWIGMFTPAGTEVPKEFSFLDFPAMGLGTCWLYGKENEIHNTSACLESLFSAGMI